MHSAPIAEARGRCMCASYFIHGPVGGPIRQAFDDLLLPAFEHERIAIRPTDSAPVLRMGDTGATLQAMQWGLIPPWARDPSIARHTFNARGETLAEKPAFRDAFARQRCLIAASGWHEWTGPRGHKQRHMLQADSERLTMGGLWARWRDPVGEWRHTFTIVTVAAAPSIAAIHERMPLLIDGADRAMWLTGVAHEAVALLRPWSAALRLDGTPC